MPSTPLNRSSRRLGISPSWRCYDCDEISKRDKANLDIFWLRDNTLEDSDNLPDPDILAQEIADDPQTALDQFTAVAGGLRG